MKGLYFDLITIPWSLKGLTYVETRWGPSKPTMEATTASRGKMLRVRLQKPQKHSSPKKEKTDKYNGSKIPVHAVIRSKITAELPEKFQIKELAKVCGITDLKNIFPQALKLCLSMENFMGTARSTRGAILTMTIA